MYRWTLEKAAKLCIENKEKDIPNKDSWKKINNFFRDNPECFTLLWEKVATPVITIGILRQVRGVEDDK